MIEHIHQYYLAEKSTAAISIIASVIFLVSALVLWRAFPLNQLSKGLSAGFMIIGLLLAIVTVTYTYATNQKIRNLSTLQSQTNAALQKAETARMKKVFGSTYPIALTVDTFFIIAGIAMVFAVSSDFWKGIALSLMLLGTLAHIGEAFSMQKNRAYQTKITQLNF